MDFARKPECAIRDAALSIQSIKVAAEFYCSRTSPNERSSFRCCGNCRYSFPPSKDGENSNLIRAIQLMRHEIWPAFGNASVRKAEITRQLFRDSVLTTSKTSRELVFRISGIQVCRSFYFNATAVCRRLFSLCCDTVSNAGDSLPHEVSIGLFAEVGDGMKTKEEIAVLFLDQFFSDSAALSNKGIDNDPAEMGVKTTRLTWKQIHEAFYVPFCSEYESTMTYQEFCSVRKKYRPNYRRDRKARSGGWTHLGCRTCDIYRLRILNAKRKKKLNKVVELQGRYKAHLDMQEALRQQYQRRRGKSIIRKPNIGSAIIDATSSLASSYMPHTAVPLKDEPERHTLLKMKSTFCRIHGVGTLIIQSFPELEKQGTNLILECCYRAIDEHMRMYGVDHIDTFYIQLDNTSVNKAWTLIAGLGALTLAGVIRKIKVSYLLVGHTHEDVDAIIGKVLGSIRKFDMFTFEAYRQQTDKSLLQQHCRVLDIQRIVGIPDYDAIFADFNCLKIAGLTDVQQMRILSEPDGTMLDLKYRTNCMKPGWLPSPVDTSPLFAYNWPFRHESNPARPPCRVTRTPLTGEQGRRTWWLYTAEYFGGLTSRHELPCPSLPSNLSRSSLHAKILELRRQSFKPNFFKTISEVWGRVETLLMKRKRPRADFDKWKMFFEGLPNSEDDARYKIIDSYLVKLISKYTRSTLVAKISFDHSVGPSPDDYMDPLTYEGGKISRQDLRDALKFYGFKVATRRKRDEEGNFVGEKNNGDSSDSDSCSDNSNNISSASSDDDDGYSQQSDDDAIISCPLKIKYQHLLGTFHKDDEDGQLYQVSNIAPYKYNGKVLEVAFRKRYDGVKGVAAEEEEDPPTMIADVIRMTNKFNKTKRLKK